MPARVRVWLGERRISLSCRRSWCLIRSCWVRGRGRRKIDQNPNGEQASRRGSPGLRGWAPTAPPPDCLSNSNNNRNKDMYGLAPGHVLDLPLLVPHLIRPTPPHHPPSLPTRRPRHILRARTQRQCCIVRPPARSTSIGTFCTMVSGFIGWKLV